MKVLDLFCGPGGAAVGYARAGFEVVGVDIDPQKNYPFEFRQADAMSYPLDGFDLIHASPPCQRYSQATKWRGTPEDHPDLLQPTIDRLMASGTPWIVENVPGAPMTPDVILCGSMFGLKVRRHRLFRTSLVNHLWLTPKCNHQGLLAFMHKGERAYADAMGCTWMTAVEAREAIPPAYTEFLGREFLSVFAAAGSSTHAA